MGDSSIATQTAIIAKYRGDATLQGILQGMNGTIVGPEWNIFDKGGSGQITPNFPYVYVHPITMQLGSALAMGKDANDVYLQVDVFTQSEGFSQARQIIAQCYALTHGPVVGMLTLAGGFTNVLALFENRQEREEETDRPIQHIADRYKLENQG